MDDKPECIVMGSSNSMRMLPETLEDDLGLKAFNYGVFHARAEDFYCIGKLLTAQPETTPKVVFLCVDDWNLADEPALPDEVFEGAEKRLAYKPLLSQYLDDYNGFSLGWARVKASLSWNQTETSIKSLAKAWEQGSISRKPPELTDVFFKNGVRKTYKSIFEVEVTELAESGEYDVGAALKTRHEELLSYSNHPEGFLSDSHENFKQFSERRWDYFTRFISTLNEHEVKILVNVMPNQPFYQELVEQSTNYEQRIDTLISRLNKLQQTYPSILVVKDNHTIENFGGSEKHFFDHMHPTSYNSDLMIRSVLKELPENAL